MKRKAAIAVLVIFVSYLAYCSFKVSVLSASAASLSANLAAASDLGQQATVDDLLELQKSATSNLKEASSIVSDPLLSPLYVLPFVGGDFSAAKTLVLSLAEILDKAEPLLASLDVFANTENQLDSTEASLTDNNTALKVTAIISAIDQSRKLLNNISAKDLHFGLAPKIQLAQTKLGELSAGLSNLQPLIAVLEPILATNEKQTWFVATQNLAEARGTGGILGSFAILKVDNGNLSLAGAGSDQDLDRLGRVDPRALPESLQILWGGTPDEWRDMNVSSHVPYFAEQIYETLSAKKIKIDGVIVLGQGTVAKLVAATGSLKIDGVEVNSQNIGEFLGKGVYARYENVAEKNKWVNTFMNTLFARLAKRDFDYGGIWRSATENLSGDRISAWSKTGELQSRFLRDGVAGEVSDKPGSVAQISLNNAGGNKLDAYLELEAKYSLGQCGAETDLGLPGRRAKLEMLISNNAPKSGLPKYVTPRADLFPGQKLIRGSNRTLVSVYAPTDSTIDFFTLDGEPVLAVQGFDHNHPVWVFDLSTKPGKSYRIVANWIEPTFNADGHYIGTEPKLIAPVTFNPVKTSVKTSGSCYIE